MKVQTSEFKRVLTKAMKGSSYNTFLPITCFCKIEEFDDSFFITTTDGVNTLIVKGVVDSDALPHVKLNCVVDIKAIYKLISKTTSDSISLTISNRDTLNIKGNGIYSMPLPLDENNRPVTFPTVDDIDGKVNNIFADNIREVIKSNKSSLPKIGVCDELNGYYFSDTVITTNSLIICANSIRVFDTPVMFSSDVVEMLAQFEDAISYIAKDDLYVFFDDNMRYYAYCSEHFDNYPIKAISKLIDDRHENCVTVSSKEMYDAVDRTELFISPYDANSCIVTFANDTGVVIKNQDGSCEEDVDVSGISMNDASEVTVKINAEFLKTQLKTMQDNIEINFSNNDKCISLCDEISTRIIALQGV